MKISSSEKTTIYQKNFQNRKLQRQSKLFQIVTQHFTEYTKM